MTVAIISFFIFSMFYRSDYRPFLLLQVSSLLAAAVDISWFYMGLEDFRKTVIRNTIVKVFSVVLIFLLVRSKDDLGIYIVIMTGSTLLGNLTLWPYLKKSVNKIDIKNLNIFKHVMPSIHLFIPQIAVQIYVILNKTMLGSMSTIAEVGLFENADKLIRVLLAVVTATGTVMLPRMANTFAIGNLKKVREYVEISFDLISLFSFPISFGVMAIAPKFSPFFFGSEFDGIDKIIILLSSIIIFVAWSSVIGTQFLLPQNKMKPYTISVTAGAGVNLMFNIIFIPLYGAIGAAISTMLSELAVSVIQLFYVRNELNIKKLFKNIPKYFLASSIMFLGVSLLQKNIYFSITTLIFEIIIGVIIYLGLILLLKPTSYFFLKSLVIKSRAKRKN